MDLNLLVVGDGEAGIAAARQALRPGACVALAPSGASLLDTGLRRAVSRRLSGTAPREGGELATLVARARATRRRHLDELVSRGLLLLEGSLELEEGTLQTGSQRHQVRRTLVTTRATRRVFPGAGHQLDAVELLVSGARPGRCLVVGDDVRALELASWLRRLGSQVTLLVPPVVLMMLGPRLRLVLLGSGAGGGLVVEVGHLVDVVPKEGRGQQARWRSDQATGEGLFDQVVDASPGARRDPLPALVAGHPPVPDPETRVIFTVPEMAAVGPLEPGDHVDATVLRSEVDGCPEDEGADGGLTVLFDRRTAMLVGAEAWGPRAAELIDAAALAMQQPMAAYALAALPACGTALAMIAEAARRVQQHWMP